MADSDSRDTMKHLADDVKALVSAEIALAKAELLPTVKKAGLGTTLLGGAGYFALNAATLLYIAASIGVGILLEETVGTVPAIALGFAIVAVAMLVLAGVMALVGQSLLKKLKAPKPEMTVANAQAVATDVKGAISRGKDNVPASVFQRREKP